LLVLLALLLEEIEFTLEESTPLQLT